VIGHWLKLCRAFCSAASKRYPKWILAIGFAIATVAPFASSDVAWAGALTETGNYSVSVTIKNSFSLGSLGIAFGRISALASPTDQATLTIDGETGLNSVTNGTYAQIVLIEEGVAGDVSVIAGPPNTLMSVSITTNPTTVAHNTINGGATFSAIMNVFGAGYNFTTDGAGDIVFKLGGALSTDATGGTYADGNYSGIYTVQVSY